MTFSTSVSVVYPKSVSSTWGRVLFFLLRGQSLCVVRLCLVLPHLQVCGLFFSTLLGAEIVSSGGLSHRFLRFKGQSRCRVVACEVLPHLHGFLDFFFPDADCLSWRSFINGIILFCTCLSQQSAQKTIFSTVSPQESPSLGKISLGDSCFEQDEQGFWPLSGSSTSLKSATIDSTFNLRRLFTPLLGHGGAAAAAYSVRSSVRSSVTLEVC